MIATKEEVDRNEISKKKKNFWVRMEGKRSQQKIIDKKDKKGRKRRCRESERFKVNANWPTHAHATVFEYCRVLSIAGITDGSNVGWKRNGRTKKNHMCERQCAFRVEKAAWADTRMDKKAKNTQVIRQPESDKDAVNVFRINEWTEKRTGSEQERDGRKWEWLKG